MKQKESAFKSFLFCWALACLATPALALQTSAPPARVAVRDGWVRWLPANLPAAGYATIRNGGDKPVHLTGADSPEYGMAMLHRSMHMQGKDTMQMVGSITIPAHGSVALAPGGYHLMLTNPRHPIKPGDSVHVTLHFAEGGTIRATWPVRPADATGP